MTTWKRPFFAITPIEIVFSEGSKHTLSVICIKYNHKLYYFVTFLPMLYHHIIYWAHGNGDGGKGTKKNYSNFSLIVDVNLTMPNMDPFFVTVHIIILNSLKHIYFKRS